MVYAIFRSHYINGQILSPMWKWWCKFTSTVYYFHFNEVFLRVCLCFCITVDTCVTVVVIVVTVAPALTINMWVNGGMSVRLTLIQCRCTILHVLYEQLFTYMLNGPIVYFRSRFMVPPLSMADPDGDYVCSLTDEEVLKATVELREMPADRLPAVRAFRTWIEQQSDWLTSPTGAL